MGEKWAQGPRECLICDHRYHAVWPASAPRLECPACGYMNPNEVSEMEADDDLRRDLEKYREALEDIAELEDSASVDWEFLCRQMGSIAREALK